VKAEDIQIDQRDLLRVPRFREELQKQLVGVPIKAVEFGSDSVKLTLETGQEINVRVGVNTFSFPVFVKVN